MFRALVLFCAVLALTNGETTQIEQCQVHSGSLPINTYIEGCIQPPCVLPQLQDVVINMIFRAPYVLGNNMRTLATAYLPTIIGNMPVPYPLGDNALTCNFLTNTYCPVVQGEVVQYSLRMFIESFFPEGTQASIEFRIVDDNNVPLICIRVPIRITEPVDTRSDNHNATMTVEV